MKTVGLIGLGLTGSAIARRLLGAGFGVLGFDIDPAKRAKVVEFGGWQTVSVAEGEGEVEKDNAIIINAIRRRATSG